MNAAQLLKFHESFCKEAYTLCAAKNHDYAGAQGAKPFRNFESCEALGITKTEAGILVRMTDKLNRLVTYVNDGKLQVNNEGAKDTLVDMVNYSILLAAFMHKTAGLFDCTED